VGRRRGLRRAELFADMDGWVAESNENNNAGAFQLNINWNAMAAAGSEKGKLEPQIQPPFESGAALYNLKLGQPQGREPSWSAPAVLRFKAS
jgi:hypothetical protein